MKHRICPYCNEPIVLVPSAAARAKKFGETAEYYRSLFTVCADCQLSRRRELTQALCAARRRTGVLR